MEDKEELELFEETRINDMHSTLITLFSITSFFPRDAHLSAFVSFVFFANSQVPFTQAF